MSLTIKGKLVKKLEPEGGVSKAGKDWKKQSFLVDTGAQYNPEICFQLFGEEKIQMLNGLNDGDEIEVFFNLSSREYNGRYFHNIDAWKIEKESTTGAVAPVNSDTLITSDVEPPSDKSADDLPF